MRRTYVIFSDVNKTFTYLNSYSNKTNSFEGEYSLLHNNYSKDNFFLNKFLIKNENTPVTLISDESDDYSVITKKYEHLYEDDVCKYIEEKMFIEMERTQNLFKQRSLEGFDFTVFKKLIEEELTDIKGENPSNIEDRYFNEGQKMFAKKMLRLIGEIEKKNKAQK